MERFVKNVVHRTIASAAARLVFLMTAPPFGEVIFFKLFFSWGVIDTQRMLYPDVIRELAKKKVVTLKLHPVTATISSDPVQIWSAHQGRPLL